MLRALLFVVGLIGAFYALLWLFQERLIYFPRRYQALTPNALRPPFEALAYTTSAGRQTAIWVRPTAGDAAPGRVWLVFGGNAMTALDWSDWAERHPDRDAGFLLMDYPGYGFSEGAPNRTRIVESAPAAFTALATRLGLTPDALAARTHLLGHSLGAAAALEFATRQPPRGLVLTAPFSTLADVAAHHYGPLVRPLVTERWDNAARLAELGAHAPGRPPLVIVHGDADEVIPFALGERLAAAAPWAKFVPVPGARHNDLYDRAPEVIRQAMAEVAGR